MLHLSPLESAEAVFVNFSGAIPDFASGIVSVFSRRFMAFSPIMSSSSGGLVSSAVTRLIHGVAACKGTSIHRKTDVKRLMWTDL